MNRVILVGENELYNKYIIENSSANGETRTHDGPTANFFRLTLENNVLRLGQLIGVLPNLDIHFSYISDNTCSKLQIRDGTLFDTPIL